jgi:hypothetical protein
MAAPAARAASKHGQILETAYRSLAAAPGAATVRAQGGARLCLNRDLLLFHSPWLRGLLASDPAPHLLLPSAPPGALLALESLLTRGTCLAGDPGEVREAAALLGVRLQGLALEGTGATVQLAVAAFQEVTGVKQEPREPEEQLLRPEPELPSTLAELLATGPGADTCLAPSGPETEPGQPPAKRRILEPTAIPVRNTAIPTRPMAILIAIPARPTATLEKPIARPIAIPARPTATPAAFSSTTNPAGPARPKNVATAARPAVVPVVVVSKGPGGGGGAHWAVVPPTTAPDTTPRRPPTTDSPSSPACNFSLQCEVCSAVMNSVSNLHTHCSSHFHRRIEEKHQDIMDDLKCRLCGQVFKSRYTLTVHIGCKHGKVNNVLLEKGYKVLPCPVTGQNQAKMQQNLLSIKKEKLEAGSFEPEASKPNDDVHQNNLNRILEKYNRANQIRANHGI